jgi:streptogramin lyase
MALRSVLAVGGAAVAVFAATVSPPERGGAAGTPSLGEFTAFPTGDRAPGSITAGPDGNMWFVDNDAPRIGRITADGQVTDFSTASGQPGGHSLPGAIAAGPDGNLWFTDEGGLDGGVESIGRMTPDGQLTEFSAGLQASNGSVPDDIAAGPDGNLWFLDQGDPRKGGVAAIGRITTGGAITEFTHGLAPGRGTDLEDIAAGPDGNVWFTNAGDNAPAIGRITPSGQIIEFSASLPQRHDNDLGGLAAGPNASMWFTHSGSPSAVERVTATGAVPASASRPPAFLLTCVRRSKFEGQSAWKCQSRLIARPLRSAGALKAVVSSPDGIDATGAARYSGTKLIITLTTIRLRMLNITPGYTVKLTHGHKRQTTTFDLDY